MSSKKYVEKNAPVDSDFSLEAVPESARKGFRSLFFVSWDSRSFLQV